MKKIVCCLLSALMLFGCMTVLAGCGGDNKKVTLSWYLVTNGQKDEKIVQAEFNKQLAKYLPNTQVEFKEEIVDNWSRWMASRKAIDIAWTGYSFNMESEISKDSYMELNDLIDKYAPNIKKEMQEYSEDYASAMVDGKLYAIPNQQPIISETPYLKIPAACLKYFDVDAFRAATAKSPYTNTDDIYQIFDKYFRSIKSAGVIGTDTVGKYMDPTTVFTYIAKRGYDSIGRTSLCYKAFDDNVNVVKFEETDEYKLWCKWAAKWYNDGYIAKDVLQSEGSSGSQIPTLDAHLNEIWFGLTGEEDNAEKGLRAVYNVYDELEKYNLLIEPKDRSHSYKGTSTLGSEKTYLCIPFTAKNPERAIKLLDLLRAEKGTDGNKLLNLLVYGFEKNSEEAKKHDTYHYTLEGDCAYGTDYTIQPGTSSAYGIPHWQIGNVFLTYRTPNILEGQQEYAREYESSVADSAHKTPLAGFRFNISNIATEVGNLESVTTEFNNRLVCGVSGSGWTDIYDQMLKKYNSAGLDKVKQDVEKQIQAYKK